MPTRSVVWSIEQQGNSGSTTHREIRENATKILTNIIKNPTPMNKVKLWKGINMSSNNQGSKYIFDLCNEHKIIVTKVSGGSIKYVYHPVCIKLLVVKPQCKMFSKAQH